MSYIVEQEFVDNINNILISLESVDPPAHADENYVLSCIEILQLILDAIYKTDSKFQSKKMLYPELLEQYVYEYFGDRLYDNPFMFNESPEMKGQLRSRFKYLSTLEQPPQRSLAWHAYRNNCITASDSASILNKNPYKVRHQLLLEKSLVNNKFINLTNDAIRHGVMFEEVVCKIYEYFENTTVKEFGCLPHDTISYVGASPDGIDENGIMLEIKCPTGRKIFGYPPYVYWHQMQQQLEVADLNLCHYVECSIKVIKEDEFINNFNKAGTKYIRGIVIEYYNMTSNKLEYLYYPYRDPLKYYKEWVDNNIDIICKDNMKDFRNTVYWKLDIYTICNIYRNKRWFERVLPEYTSFWTEVLYNRENPEQLQQKVIQKEELKKNRKRIVKKVCLIAESDDD